MHRIKKFVGHPAVIIPILILCLLISGYFATRGAFLRKAISSVNTKLEKSNYSAYWDNVRFQGVNSIFVNRIDIVSNSGTKEAHIDSILIRVRLLPLIAKRVIIQKLDCRAIAVSYTPAETANVPISEPADSIGFFQFSMDRDLAGTAYQYIRRIINHIPSKVFLGTIAIRYNYSGNISVLSVRKLSLKRGEFSSNVSLGNMASETCLPLKGSFDRSNSIIRFSIVNSDTGLISFPLLKDKFGLAAGFDSLDFMVNMGKRNRHLVYISGQTSVTGFELNGERLSTGNITINKFNSLYKIRIGSGSIEVDSSSLVLLNKISFKPFVRLNLTDGLAVDFRILPQQWDANDFFSSLPPGMFTSLIGTKAQGFLDFFLDFSVNPDQPDSLSFNISLKGKDFNLLSFGTDDYTILNRSFNHNVYYKGRLAATFVVGPENADYTPYEAISPFLRSAVMTSEDGSFFYHRGFNPDAFRESIATNIKEERFARGGSTISMQLIKNVFLTRNKTIARKIEEALIVWLIENLKLVSKQRMYEVYLNIIEWGPGVYGIGQASRYYFNKIPSQLTLDESVFLASIVPRPKWFKYTFEANGKPKPFFAVYFDRMKELMLRKEFITPSDTVGVKPLITLTGQAAQALDTSDLKNVAPDFRPLEPIIIRKISY